MGLFNRRVNRRGVARQWVTRQQPGERQRIRRKRPGLTAECLEHRWLLSASTALSADQLFDHLSDNAPTTSEEVSQGGRMLMQMDVDRSLYRRDDGRLIEMIWEPLDSSGQLAHNHEHDHEHDHEHEYEHEHEHDEDYDHEDPVTQGSMSWGAAGGEGSGSTAMSLGNIAASDIVYTPSGIPLLDSFPSAPAAVFLDFDGNYEPRWGSSQNVITPPYDLDGDPTTFNEEEQARIVEAWQRVSEDFAPFNINVTTDDPSDAATTLNQINAAVDRVRTFYFRTTFDVTDAAQVSNLVLNVQRDDGVAIYLNGVEVVRDNLAEGAGYRDFALSGISGDDEAVYNPFPVDAGLLVNGENLLAVEIHQQSDTSSDVGFDMSVTATVGGSPNQVLLPTGAVWNYLDDGSDQGTAWQAVGYDDSNWPTGPAKLGYGDADIVTNLSVFEEGAPRVRTYYFRHEFEVGNPAAVSDLRLGLLRDDGAAVYLNGVEVARDNLAPGAQFDDFALSSVNGDDESRFFSFDVLPSHLVTGRNVLAVEVHQQSDTSSDVSFDLGLVGTVAATPSVFLVPTGSTWSYLDDGSDQGTAWQSPSFDDSSWRSGQAQFGYGDVEVGTVHVAIGREDWFDGGAGGVAFVNSFSLNGRTTVFTFTNGAGSGAKNVAEVSSHEAGHAFGLGHQSTFDPNTGEKLQEYNPGSGNWAPIMGVSYGPALSTWHDGPTGSINNLQDDMARIARTNNGFGYRDDDHGDNAATATPLTARGGGFEVAGIIAQNTDVDAFSFSIAGDTLGGINVRLDNAPVGPNLDGRLDILDAGGNTVATHNPGNSLDAALDVSLPPGDYTLLVRSNGAYGRVGQYTLTGDLDESRVVLDNWQRTGVLGSLAAVSETFPARIHFDGDVDQFAVYGQRGQLLTASVVPVNAATRLTVEVPGLVAPITAPRPGAPVVVPLTELPADGVYELEVRGTDTGAYEMTVGWNTALELTGSNDGVPILLDGSDAGLLTGRLSATGLSGDGSDAARTLVPRGSVWKYLDDGSNQADAWFLPDFDDSNWAGGTAEMGYGDGDEVTVLNETSANGDRVRTFYFRRAFQVVDIASIENLQLSLKRDDGAAVYLNGVEIRRDNLAPNAAFDDFALETTDDEDVFLDSGVFAGLLVPGTNVLAVEVHQQSDGSSDVSFDLELRANVVNQEPIQFPAVPAGSAWRYLDDGSNQGTAWRQPDFNDSGWSVGNAELGYGESEQTTLRETRGNGTRIRTFYFRREFNLSNVAQLDQATLRLLRDDGAAVYLNGVEIRRDNLVSNAAFDDHASATVSGGAESQYFESTFDAALLNEGRNVLAVEVHQQSDTSSDVSFDLELLVEDIPQSLVTLVPPGDNWRYLDNGSDQGTAWRAADFSDSSWPTGPAQLGYGDGDEATDLNRTNNTGQRIRTFYFRNSFAVADPTAVGELTLSLKYDDGAAVYLNGTEVVRENLSPNARFDDLATAGADDENAFFDFAVDPTLLVPGNNVLAVEVHQDSDTSSDVSFDLSLRARRANPEVDVFTFNVTPAQTGKSWDLLLAGVDADFSGERLQLIGPDEMTVLASATAAPTDANYDLGILDLPLNVAGTYTLRLRSFTQGMYGITVASDVVLELEPNQDLSSPSQLIAVGKSLSGFTDASAGDDDHFTTPLLAGIPVAFATRTPLDNPNGSPANTLNPALSIFAPNGNLVAADADSGPSDNALIVFTPQEDGDYVVQVSATAGAGEYVLTVALPGDANLDGRVTGQDLAIWQANRFSTGNVSWTDADFNNDGTVDGRDFIIWNAHKFTAYPLASAAQSTPRAAANAAAIAPPVRTIPNGQPNGQLGEQSPGKQLATAATDAADTPGRRLVVRDHIWRSHGGRFRPETGKDLRTRESFDWRGLTDVSDQQRLLRTDFAFAQDG